MIAHFFLVLALTFVLLCLGYGVIFFAWLGWSLLWMAFDYAMERWTRRRNGYRKSVHIIAPPSHAVGRDVYQEWKR